MCLIKTYSLRRIGKPLGLRKYFQNVKWIVHAVRYIGFYCCVSTARSQDRESRQCWRKAWVLGCVKNRLSPINENVFVLGKKQELFAGSGRNLLFQAFAHGRSFPTQTRIQDYILPFTQAPPLTESKPNQTLTLTGQVHVPFSDFCETLLPSLRTITLWWSHHTGSHTRSRMSVLPEVVSAIHTVQLRRPFPPFRPLGNHKLCFIWIWSFETIKYLDQWDVQPPPPHHWYQAFNKKVS